MGFLASQTSYRANPAQIDLNNYQATIAQAQGQGFTPNNNLVDNSLSNQTRGQNEQYITALQNMMSGQGPSLANTQLQAATDLNNRQAAGQIASIRGMNPATAARLILQNRAANDQTAANQSAQTRIQEQQMAMGQMGSTLANQRALDINQAQGNTAAGINTINANANMLGTAGGLQDAQNNSRISNDLGSEGINANIALSNTQGKNNILGGLIGAGGSIGAMAAMPGTAAAGAGAGGGAGAGVGAALGALAASKGGEIPGKAKVEGDSPKNDTVPAILSPGEIVLPRSVSKDPEAAKKFVEAIRQKNAKATSYGKVLEAHRNIATRLAHLERLCYGGMSK